MNSTKRFIGLPIILIGLCVALIVSNGAFAGGAVSLESLLEEMVDRGVIARLAEPGYTCRQFSSYDRNSTEPGSATWWANWDRSYFVRVEENDGRKEHVMMDAEGPGAVVRIWATWHGPGGGPFSNGTLRVYLDRKPEPVIEGPMEDLISKQLLVAEPLSRALSREGYAVVTGCTYGGEEFEGSDEVEIVRGR